MKVELLSKHPILVEPTDIAETEGKERATVEEVYHNKSPWILTKQLLC
ncbi:hypothetical protein NXY40_21775 [Phocaeicola vulgatus]|nr:hypothetical protein [Phocaeicola vulgatus]